MQKHCSVLLLAIRSTMLPACLVLLTMLLVQTGLFVYDLKTYAEAALDVFPEQLPVQWCFIAAICVLSGFLGQFGSKSGSTLRRLSVSEQMVFVWHGVCNLLWYLIFWTLETLLLVVLCQVFFSRYPDLIGSQGLLLAVHRSAFFHGLLPMEDVLLWISNGLLLLALAVSAAHFPYALRRSKPLQELLPMLLLFAWSRNPVPGVSVLKILVLVCSVLVIIYAFRCVFGEEDVLHET